MSFVIYDVETTGLTKRFDQIVQFAAVLTDLDLNVKDRIEIGCRLMPHVIPSPEGDPQVTGLRIEQLLDASLPSHYEMVTEIRRNLESWSPTLFLGFNSLSFDEEFLRQAFYLCSLQPIPDEYVRQCPRRRPESLPHDRGPQTRCLEARDRRQWAQNFQAQAAC